MGKARKLSITLDFGYGSHRIAVAKADWDVVLLGIPTVLDGKGICLDGEKFSDSWRFNFRTLGSLIVAYGNDGGELYVGSIFDGNLSVEGKVPTRPTMR